MIQIILHSSKKKRVKKGKNLKSIIKDYFNSNTEEENNDNVF